MPRHDRDFYEFGPFRIGKHERLLRRGTNVLPLPPKAVDVLLALVERGGDAVGKEELLRQVWPETFVEEGSLAQNVSLLRKVLGDRPGTPYIETLPRRGYRFVAPTRTVREEHDGPRSLAVLPLADLSGDHTRTFFAEGMTDELISCLMTIGALRVASRTSAMAYANAGKPLPQIARELDVDYVIEGAVVQADGRVRIAAHLIDGATETQLWADTYERDLRDVLSLQRDVARAIASQIRVRVTGPEHSRMASAPRVDPEAYDAYLRGLYYWNKRTAADLRHALDYFTFAVDRDSSYGPAHTGLADTYALLGTVGFDAMPPREAMPRAKQAATRALQLDDGMARAHTSLGYVQLSYDWDWLGAQQQFDRSLACNAGYGTAHLWHGHCLFATGQIGEAAQEMRRALELDPLSIPCQLGVGWSYYYSRQFDEAIAHYRRLLEIVPDLTMVWYELGLAYQASGYYGDALAAFERADTLSGGEPAAAMLLGHLHALTGRRADARRQLARLEEMSVSRYVPALYTAFVHAGAADADQFFAWLDRAYEERSSYLIYLGVEPALDSMRQDPRYGAFLQRIGLAGATIGTPAQTL